MNSTQQTAEKQKATIDPVVSKIISDDKWRKNGKEPIYMVAALMINEGNIEEIIAFKNKETGLYELIGGKRNNEDLHDKQTLDREFKQELGIAPPIIGEIFGIYPIQEIIGVNGEKKEIIRVFNIIHIGDYGELPEKPIDKKYSDKGLINCLSYNSRNDLSFLTARVCEDYSLRLKKEGYKFKS